MQVAGDVSDGAIVRPARTRYLVNDAFPLGFIRRRKDRDEKLPVDEECARLRRDVEAITTVRVSRSERIHV